jgi:hypothetical protein
VNLTYAVLTRNEQAEIAGCIRSCGPDGDLLVFDSLSTDATQQRAREAAQDRPGGLRIEQHPFTNYAEQRDAALAHVRTQWVLFIDADERATPALIAEVCQRISSPGAPAGFWVPRHNVILGHRMRHAGWFPDYQLRLFQTAKGKYDPLRPVHEGVLLDGTAEHLSEPFIHYNYRSMRQLIDKQRRYARHDAHQLWQEGVRFRPRSLASQPAREFVRRYVTLAGWRDGAHGLLMSAVMAWYRLAVLGELRRQQQR